MNRTKRLLATALFGLVAMLVSSLPASGQDAIYVDLTSVAPGESNDVGHEDWIRAFALDHSLIHPASAPESLSEIAFLKATDLATPRLHDLAAAGTTVGSDVTIDVCNLAGSQECFYQLRLRGAVVRSVALTSSACLDPMTCPSRQTESVTLSFTKVTWRYILFVGGTPDVTVEKCWDVNTHGSCTPF